LCSIARRAHARLYFPQFIGTPHIRDSVADIPSLFPRYSSSSSFTLSRERVNVAGGGRQFFLLFALNARHFSEKENTAGSSHWFSADIPRWGYW
jgi:hypothetical protein